MHEIPNLPFPSLQQPEQAQSTTAGHEPAYSAKSENEEPAVCERQD
ncbi:hypothetical protein [Pseudomonas sp. R5(2019)]|nr:hypothetical protein [Pseudomonas sp. R5(2019)]NBA98677.1 hypothetical protein [Pseudomonas sp. R5(2019)]